jgi:RNA polymerase sigma-70 factor (ECF subfamily)
MEAEKRGGVHGFSGVSCAEYALIQKAKDGDEQAFESLMNLHLKVIYNYIRIYVSNSEDIKDILQELMLSIWMSLKTFNSQSAFKTWVIGIVRRRIADHFRMIYRTQYVPISDFEDTLICDLETDSIDSKLDINKAVETLSGVEREIVFLTFTAQLTYSEISEIMHIPVGTVKSKMFGIKKKLRAQLERGG